MPHSKLSAFFISFFLTLLLMTGALATVIIFRDSRPQTAALQQHHQPQAVYLPPKEDRLVLLLSCAEAEDIPPDLYLLAGFLPDKGRIALCLLPPKTMVLNGEQYGTLDALHTQGGTAYVAKALGSYLGVDIERNAQLEVTGLKKLMETIGFYKFFLPCELDYPLHQRQIAMSRGEYRLDGRKLADLLCYPAYPGGEKERSDRGAMLLTQMLNAHLPDCNTPQGDRQVQVFLNSCRTNLSFQDYEERRSSTKFLAALELPAATAVYVEGELSRDYSSFWLTEGCRARLTSTFGGDGFLPTPDPLTQPEARVGAYDRVESEPKP
ncbi:MAG: hypothetical protein RR185_06740 [Angelakisella sp.]